MKGLGSSLLHFMKYFFCLLRWSWLFSSNQSLCYVLLILFKKIYEKYYSLPYYPSLFQIPHSLEGIAFSFWKLYLVILQKHQSLLQGLVPFSYLGLSPLPSFLRFPLSQANPPAAVWPADSHSDRVAVLTGKGFLFFPLILWALLV